MRQELENALRLARELHREELPRLLGDLEEIRATATARLTTPSAPTEPDGLLDVNEAAGMLRVSTDYLYHNHKRYPFTWHIGERLLFSRAGIEKYLKTAVAY